MFPGNTSTATAVGRAQQPEHDLLLALLAVPVVAEGGQRAEPPLQIARAHAVEDQGGALEVPVGEAGLDPLLAGEQPVEHGEHLVARDGAEIEQGAEAGVGRFRRESSRSGELGVRGEHEVAFAAAMQDGGFVGAVGDNFDVEGNGRVLWEHYRQCIRS